MFSLLEPNASKQKDDRRWLCDTVARFIDIIYLGERRLEILYCGYVLKISKNNVAIVAEKS